MKRGRSKATAAVEAMPERPAAPAPHATLSAAPSAGLSAGFSARAAAGGCAWLSVQPLAGQAPPRNAAEAALLLHELEPLLSALDAWLLGSPLAEPDWRWCATCPPTAPQALAGWAAAAEIGLHVTLGLPWTLLRRLPPPPPALALQWQAADAVAVLAQPTLAAPDLAALEPGGALLLQPSFEARWLGRLRAATESAHVGVPVHWVAPGQPQPLPGAAGEAMPGGPLPALEVRCLSRLPLPAEVLAGWATLPAAPEPAWQDEVSLWALACAEGQAERCLARGQLLPWGRGQALSLATVLADAAV